MASFAKLSRLGWRDSSVGKTFAMQVEDLSLNSQNLCESVQVGSCTSDLQCQQSYGQLEGRRTHKTCHMQQRRREPASDKMEGKNWQSNCLLIITHVP